MKQHVRPFIYRYLFILLVSPLLLSSCEKATEPEPDGGGSGGKKVTIAEISDLPMLGGNFTDVEVLDDAIVAILDGKIMRYDLNFENGQEINSDDGHLALGALNADAVYTVTLDKEIRTYDLNTKTFKTTPYQIQYNISDAEFKFTSKNDPYIVITHGSSRGVTYFSRDNGGSWQMLSNPPGAAMSSFDITFDQNDDPLWVGPSGVFRTTDDGASWTMVTTQGQNFEGVRALATSTGAIYSYVKGFGGLKRSVDGGATFSDVTANVSLNVISLLEGNDGALYVISGLGATGYSFHTAMSQLMRSTDGGATWKHLLFCNSSAFSINGGRVVLIDGGFFSDAMTGTMGGGFVSSNSGATWQSRGTLPVETISDIAINPAGELYMLANHTLFKRTGSTWETFGMNRGRFQSFAVNKDNKILLTSSTSGDFFDPVAGRVVRSAFDYIPGLGTPTVMSTLATHTGDFIVPIGFYYNQHYPSGATVRLDAQGALKPNGNSPGGIENLVANPDGLLYGTVSTLNGFTQQYQTYRYQSQDGGVTWIDQIVPEFAPIAFSNTHALQFKQGKLSFGEYATVQGSEITLDGFNWANERPREWKLTVDNKLYFISLEVTNSKSRIMYTPSSLK